MKRFILKVPTFGSILSVTMKKKTRILLAVCAAVALIPLVVVVVFQRKLSAEYAKFRLVNTDPVNNEILAVWDKIVNFYLIRTETGWIAFDAGSDVKHIAREFKALGIDPGEVDAVFLTHSDFDHTAGVALFRNANVYLCALEEPLATGKIGRAPFTKNKLAAAATYLSDGDAVSVDGLAVRIISLPGHTPGTAAYLVEGKYLFTGDAFAIQDGKIQPHNEIFNMNTEAAMEAIHRLSAFKGVKLVLTAHYGVSSRAAELFGEYESRPKKAK